MKKKLTPTQQNPCFVDVRIQPLDEPGPLLRALILGAAIRQPPFLS